MDLNWSTGSTGVISKIDYTKQCDFQNSRVIHVGWWTFVLFKNGPMMKLGLEKRRMMAHTFPKTLWCRTVLVAPYNINVQIDRCHHFLLPEPNPKCIIRRPIRSTKHEHVFYVNVQKKMRCQMCLNGIDMILKFTTTTLPIQPFQTQTTKR
jgi:hypothetical protein